MTCACNDTCPCHTVSKLTWREREIVLKVEKGVTLRDIAKSWGLAEQTIKNHLYNARRRNKVQKTVQLIDIAHR